MSFDRSPYAGCAAHYLPGRPPYSAELGAVLSRELELDGRGTLVDVGCGPGVLAVQLAPLFDQVIGIDPDVDMLREAERHARTAGRPNVEWRMARAEKLAALALPPARVVTFGQSFHWTERDVVAAAVYDALVPGGSLVAVAHDINARATPTGPGDAPIPHQEIEAIVARYLGADFRTSVGSALWLPKDRLEPAIARTRFGQARTVHAPGREDLTRDIDGVISGYLSMSWAAPGRFGDRLDTFVAEVRTALEARTTTGRFWDWPGDTAIIIARKPSTMVR